MMEICTEAMAINSDVPVSTFSWSFNPCKRFYPPGHALFEGGDIFCRVLSKQIFIPDEELEPDHSEKIGCDLVGCQKTFTSVASYEAHYSSFHRNTCLECHRTFPSNFLLDLHILENHDVLFKLMSNAKYTYRCLVESCPDKFSSDNERKEHLVNVHNYPANFRFNRPTRKQRKLPKDALENMEITTNMNTHVNAKVDVTNSSESPVSSIGKMEMGDEHGAEKRRIPKGICFGRGSMVSFQRKGPNRRGRK